MKVLIISCVLLSVILISTVNGKYVLNSAVSEDENARRFSEFHFAGTLNVIIFLLFRTAKPMAYSLHDIGFRLQENSTNETPVGIRGAFIRNSEVSAAPPPASENGEPSPSFLKRFAALFTK